MIIFDNIDKLRSYLDSKRAESSSIGLVPTMGALHDGHAQLIQKSVNMCDITVCSIFVNPTQFNNPEDLLKYPKQLESDKQVLLDFKCDIVFIPSVEEMYPNDGNKPLTFDFGFLETVMEGAFRPGHFSGVGIVVSKLLNIVQPDLAFFGQKDLQQLAIIKKLVRDLNMRTRIVPVPTVREPSGLAMSSRNLRLTDNQKVLASNIYRILVDLKNEIASGASVSEAKNNAQLKLEVIEGLQMEYLDVVYSDSMEKVNQINSTAEVSVCIAANIGDVRLIDNIYIKKAE